ELCEKRDLEVPWEVPAPPGFTSRAQMDIDKEGITSVIWTTGFRPDYGWVHAPAFDDMGFRIQTDGHSDVTGLSFLGVHFQRTAAAALCRRWRTRGGWPRCSAFLITAGTWSGSSARGSSSHSTPRTLPAGPRIRVCGATPS